MRFRCEKLPRLISSCGLECNRALEMFESVRLIGRSTSVVSMKFCAIMEGFLRKALVVALCVTCLLVTSDGKQADLGRQQEDQDTGSTTKTAMVGVSYSRMAAQAAFRAVILGAPGSGKGTISARIVKQFDVKHISSGDKLRYHIANQTDLGKKVKKYLDSGMLVPDETMIALISEEIKTLEGRNWLLDGFPRTRSQAEALQKIYPLSLVINVDVPDSVIVERLKNRWVHLPSGRVYNIGFNDPKVPGRDDVTGELLVQRPDDQPEVVQERLHVYATKTKPLIDYYKQLNVLKSFAGNTTDSMWPAIKETIGQYLGR